MKLSSRIENISESITLKLNDKATRLAQEGKKVYNLTAGQLPFRPLPQLSEQIQNQLHFLKSYQYSPVTGYPQLKEKVWNYFLASRKLDREKIPCEFAVGISNGAKHSLFNLLGLMINPGDELLFLGPYWVSYPEMASVWGATYKTVPSLSYHSYIPKIEDIENALQNKPKAIVLNSPNNPAGVHYPEDWMKSLAELLVKYPDTCIISDEIYFELNYYDPAPTAVYQYKPELLQRTFIVDGISKSLACTGLRIGYLIGPKEIVSQLGKLQGHSTSGPNSLIQKALIEFDFQLMDEFLTPVKAHLRANAEELKALLSASQLESIWYQCNSAFYFLFDFSKTPFFLREYGEGAADQSEKICEDLLERKGVALVPGSGFGIPNSARMSLVSEKKAFREGVESLIDFIKS